MAAMTSFHAPKCYHLMSEHKASVDAHATGSRQLLIYSTFVLVFVIIIIIIIISFSYSVLS